MPPALAPAALPRPAVPLAFCPDEPACPVFPPELLAPEPAPPVLLGPWSSELPSLQAMLRAAAIRKRFEA